MKASELRIGNYAFDEKGEVVNITLSLFGNELHYGDEFEHFNPIPPTTEWLMLFGFKPNHKLNWTQYELFIDHHNYIGLQEKMKISITNQKLFINDKFIRFCEHVHILQNFVFFNTETELQLINEAVIK